MRCYGKVVGYGEKEYLGYLKIEIPLQENKFCTFAYIPYQSIFMGKKHGLLLYPEINDFVVIELDEKGNPIYCREGLFTSQSELLKKLNKDNDIKAFKTRSGHTIVFDDKEETIYMQTKENASILLDNKKKLIEISVKDKVSIKQEQSQILLDKGSFTIKAEKDISLVCGKSKITLKKDGTLELSAIKVSIKGKMQTEINTKNLNMKALMTNFK